MHIHIRSYLSVFRHIHVYVFECIRVSVIIIHYVSQYAQRSHHL